MQPRVHVCRNPPHNSTLTLVLALMSAPAASSADATGTWPFLHFRTHGRGRGVGQKKVRSGRQIHTHGAQRADAYGAEHACVRCRARVCAGAPQLRAPCSPLAGGGRRPLTQHAHGRRRGQGASAHPRHSRPAARTPQPKRKSPCAAGLHADMHAGSKPEHPMHSQRRQLQRRFSALRTKESRRDSGKRSWNTLRGLRPWIHGAPPRIPMPRRGRQEAVATDGHRRHMHSRETHPHTHARKPCSLASALVAHTTQPHASPGPWR
jgi:hypothetical protein